jgi:hypothetical protein
MTPARIFEELLRHQKVSAADTADLSSWKHDDLCRDIEDKVDHILKSFEKYPHVVYMLQGLRDNGVDLVYKSTEADGTTVMFGMQVKSYRELEDRKNGLTQKLKAGFFDANSSYGARLDRYYIFLFGDAVRHAKRITAITNEFAKEEKVRVIGPRHLMAFIEMPDSTISAFVDRYVGGEDPIRQAAREEVEGYEQMELYFLLSCICWALESGDNVLPENFFEEDTRLSEIDSLFGDGSLEECVSISSGSDLECYARPFSCRVRLEDFPGIQALYHNIRVSGVESPDDIFNYLFEFLHLPLLGSEKGT